VPMNTTFGSNHKVTATGATSAATATATITLPAFVTVTPGTGRPGTALSITSGPGWPVGDSVTLTWGGTKIATRTADSNGTVSAPYTVPSKASGTIKVKASDTALRMNPTFAFVVSDAAPTIAMASITPSKPFTSSTLTAVASNVSDPDGDALTYHYAWTVNGSAAGADASTLGPSAFTNGSSVGLTITVVDPYGLSASAAASAVSVSWNVVPSKAGVPGGTVSIHGSGFGPSETVDVHLDSATGPVLRSGVTDSTGAFPSVSTTLPSPLTGGTHQLYGVGRTSGIVGPGVLSVTPAGTLTPAAVASGDPTTYAGVGFMPGEQVSVSFPGGTPLTATADATGSVSVALTSPPEPAGGGVVTAAAPSGSATSTFTVVPRLSLSQTTSEPGRTVPATLSGFGASETVSFTIDGTQVSTATTDATGSASTTVPMNTTFGSNHKVTATGATSAATATATITLPAFVTLSPNTGPVGTVVTITSGPGWVAGETLQLKWGNTVVQTLTADGTGSVSTTYTIPQHVTGTVTISLTDTVLGQQGKASFTIV
jgi:hypothetical protein